MFFVGILFRQASGALAPVRFLASLHRRRFAEVESRDMRSQGRPFLPRPDSLPWQLGRSSNDTQGHGLAASMRWCRSGPGTLGEEQVTSTSHELFDGSVCNQNAEEFQKSLRRVSEECRIFHQEEYVKRVHGKAPGALLSSWGTIWMYCIT